MFYKAPKVILIFACLNFVIVFRSFSFNTPSDSVGIEKLGNKTFILHEVEAKETLFSLAKRYHVKVSLIEAENPDLKTGMKVGQVLRIPYVTKAQIPTNSANAKSTPSTHVVDPGQTLYSIARMYKVSVEDIKKWNNLPSNEITVGKEIIVAEGGKIRENATLEKNTTTPITAASAVVKDVPNFKYDSKGNKIHITEEGQTLFSISQIYHVSLDDLKVWNSLSKNEIALGQEIIVEKVKEKEIAKPREKVEGDSNRSIYNSNQTTNNSNAPKKQDNAKIEDYRPETMRSESGSNNFNKVIERGLAESIEESSDSPKYLALHKTANVGTIIQVKNELNNMYIFARVIGKLPDTGSNDKLVVKLSKKAYDKLGAVDKRFPVEVSYVPNN